MLPADALSRDDEQLLPLVIAIADGMPVDWSSAPPPLVHQLQHLERIVRGHEAVRSSAPRQGAPTDETLLTEVRRKNGQTADPLRVQWGSLVVHEKIGRGSFGDVYRAWDPRLDRQVALKLIPQNTSAADTSPVVEEGRLLARVRHPNVMVVYGAERIDGRVGIWTEYVDGETLASEVGRRGRLSAEEATRVGVDVCAALAAVHTAGLLHRDVKAQNIMRDASGRVALADFGTGVELTDHARVTDPQIAGTPLYLAPEVLEGKPASTASDLYAVGVLLYFLVTGAYPVGGRTLAEIKHAHAARRRQRLREARSDLPDGLVQVIDKLLAADPGQRHATAEAAKAALESCLTPTVVVEHRARRPFVLAGCAAAIVLAVTVAGWSLSRPRDSIAPAPSGTAAFALNAGDWILVSDIENQTGEAVLDGTLRAAMERELEYSDYLRVVQRDRIEDALRLLRRPLNSRLNRPLALQLSRRDGAIGAVIAGRIARAATGFALTFEAVTPADGRRVTSVSDDAHGHADILSVVRRQTLHLRHVLGEPAASVERSRVAMNGATLPSLRAMNLVAHARGTIDIRRGGSLSGWGEVATIARDVIQEDPSWPAGYLMLAWASTLQGRREEGLANTERALRLADAATPQERLFMIATRHQFRGWGADGPPVVADPLELEQSAAALEALFTLQPDHYLLGNLLRDINLALGRDRDLAWMNLRLADARPWNVRVNYAVANHQLREGNLGGARRYGTRAESALLAGASDGEPDLAASVRLFPAYVAWLQDDAPEMLRLLDRTTASVRGLAGGERRQVLRRLWTMYAAAGRLRQAEQALDAARAHDPGDFVYGLNTDLGRAQLYMDRGDLRGLRAFAETRWKDPLPEAAPPFAARRLAFLIEAGLLDAAERDLEWFQRRTADAAAFPLGMLTAQFHPFLEASRGALEFARGRPAAAVAHLEPALPAIRKGPPQVLSASGSIGQYAALTLASAHEALGNVAAAIGILEEATADRVGITIANTPNRWLRARAQLARLYRKNGQADKARTIEAQLLKLLVAADGEQPVSADLHRRQ